MGKWELPKDPKFYNWESPITKIYGEMENQIIRQEQENYTFAITQAIGYSVDKQELIKALQYDRDQYEKGYRDGAKETFKAELEAIKTEIENIDEPEYDFEGFYKCQSAVLDILNKYILKGED